MITSFFRYKSAPSIHFGIVKVSSAHLVVSAVLMLLLTGSCTSVTARHTANTFRSTFYCLMSDTNYLHPCEILELRDSSVVILNTIDSTVAEIPVTAIYSIKVITVSRSKGPYNLMPGPAGSSMFADYSYFDNMYPPGNRDSNLNGKRKMRTATYPVKGKYLIYQQLRNAIASNIKH